MPESKIQTSFAAGELSKYLYARVDIDKFQVGAALLRNFYVDWRGGSSNRPGTKYCGKCKQNGARLMPFDFSTDVTYMMELGQFYIRFQTNGNYITNTPIPIAGVTNANPGVINVNAHGYVPGQEIILSNMIGMPQLNGRNVVVNTVPDANHFTVKDLFGNVLDTTLFGTYSGAGNAASIFELATPYLAQDVFTINFVQSADVVTLVHPNYVPYNLTRVNASMFTLVADVPGPIMQPPTSLAATPSTAGANNYGYAVTALNEDGSEESLISVPAVASSKLLDQTATPPIEINLKWTAPAGIIVSAYNIYKWGPIGKSNGTPPTIFGYIGQTNSTSFTDNNIACDFSKVPDNFADPFSPGQLTNITVLTGGAYTSGGTLSYVALTITGDGTGAAGYAVIDYTSGQVVGAFLTAPGKGYSTATVTAGAGGATFKVQISPLVDTFPSVVSYVQQRRSFAAPLGDPQAITMSQTGNYDNFNFSPVVGGSDAITLRLASTEVDYIRSMTPMSTGLVILTTGGAWLLSGGTPGAPITPSATTVTRQASHGANSLPPIVWNYDILYMQQKGNTVRDLAFNFYLQSYVGNDRSYLSQHLFTNFSFIQWCAAQEPLKLVWVVRNDGVALALTYLPEQEVYGWSHHDTQGLFRSVATVSEGDVDAVYFIVSRYVQPGASCGSGWYDYIERLDDRKFDCTEDVWFLDCALSNDKQFPNYTVADSGPISIVGGNAEVCIPPSTIVPLPPGTGTFSPSTTLTDYVFAHSPILHYADGYVDFDGNNAVFEAAAVGSDPQTGGHSMWMFNAQTQVLTQGPLDPGGFAASGTIGARCMGLDGNLYYGNNTNSPRVGRYNTHLFKNDLAFLDTHSLDTPGNMQTIVASGSLAVYAFYSSINSGGVGSRINVINMTDVGGPAWTGATYTVSEAPGSLTGDNAYCIRGPVGWGYAVAGDAFPAIGASTVMGVYSINVLGPSTVTFTRVGGITPANINTFTGLSWTSFGMGNPIFDETDGNVIMMVSNGSVTKLMKFNPQTAAIIWVSASVNAPLVDLSRYRVRFGKLTFLGGAHSAPWEVYKVNTLTGAIDGSTTQSLVTTGTLMGDDKTGLLVMEINNISNIQWATFGVGPAPNFANGGDVIQIGCGKLLVKTVDNNMEVHGTVLTPITNQIPNDPSGATLPVAPGTWSVATPTETVTGLWHLEGKSVLAVADGNVVGPFTVTNGTITLPHFATNILVGLFYNAQLQTLYLDAQGQGKTIQGQRKTIPAATIRVADSRGPKIGRTFDPGDLVEMEALMMLPGVNPMPLVTGDFREVLFSDWETTGQLCIQQDYPMPLTVLAIMPEFVRGDTGN